MILVSVGMQLGFDRLVEEMDRIAAAIDTPVIAQTGKGTYEAQHMEQHVSIAPVEFDALVSRCEVVVSHAGIGNVLTAQRNRKPIVLFPRRADFGEHRNDHQLATVSQLKGRNGIFVAANAAELRAAIDAAMGFGQVEVTRGAGLSSLESAVAGFIETGRL